MSTSEWQFQPGETALTITVPEAEPLVGNWRAQYDASARAGVPAHVTVVYPFLHRGLIDKGVRDQLERLFAAHSAFPLSFGSCARFPEVLYLEPTPDAPVRALIADVTARWPEVPPYGGKHGDPVPHLTVAGGAAQDAFTAIEDDLFGRLPFSTQVAAVDLDVVDATGRWQHWQSFALGAR